MRVLHIISSGGMYGAEAVILNMSRTLNESGHSSVLGIFSNSENPKLQLHEVAQQEGIESYLIPCKGRIDTVVSSRIRELAVRIKADVVHAHGYKADIYVYFALRGTAIPFVSTCHTWYDNDLQLRLYGIVDRLVLKRFAAVISVSDDVTSRLQRAGVDPKSISMIANGIDLRPFDRAEPRLRVEFGLTNELVVGLIGRLAQEKGVDVFIRAAAKVLYELPDTRFFVVGDGPDREGLESLIAELKIYDRVTLTGRRSDMPAVYASLDLMVSSSRQEGLPIAILEGMATGLAIIATKVGQVPTVVVDDETGLLIAPEDVDALAAAMTILLKDTARRKRYGNAARGKIEREFSAARMTEDYLTVYEAVCTEARSGVTSSRNNPKIFMMDLWAIVPYYTAYLSKALRAEGADVMVGSITYYLDPTCFTSRGIKVDPGLLDFVGRFKLPQLLRRGLKLAEALVNMAVLVCRFAFSPPDIVHIQYLPMLRWRVPLDLWFLEFCRWRGARLVLTVHDLLPHDTAEVYRATFQKLYGMVDGVICHSEHIKARLSEEFFVDRETVAVIPHGPFFYDLPLSHSGDVLRRLGVDETKTLVLWQGIIFPYKGIDLLLDAWRTVELNDPDAVLIIAGTGAPELLRQIEQEIASNELHHVMTHFRFVTTEELVALYRVADVVVYPYRAISTSGALATGLALGKCIIASNLPVFRELLVSGTNALLVNPMDREELAAALLNVIADPELRARLSERVTAMNFGDASWHAIALETRLVYGYLLLRLNVI